MGLVDLEMKEPKLIGLMGVWGVEDWIRPAIKQALEYCDEVIICVAAYSENLKKFEDNTHEIAMSFKDIKMVSFTDTSTLTQTRPQILNAMLKESKYLAADNWIWMLDVDEFYPESSFEEIKEVIRESEFDQITIKTKFFLINMRHYLKAFYPRLFKIKEGKLNEFRPTQGWQGGQKTLIMPSEEGMFHYSLLLNPDLRREQWKTEYPGKVQANKTTWLDSIYLNYDLGNEEYWINKNKELFGIKSPFFTNCFSPDKNGKLFRYEGRHPKFVEEAGLTKIKDFRGYYNINKS